MILKIQKLKAKGFTLIELLVVMAIFIIITSVVLARQNKFSSDILLTDLAYQVAISIRQAQVYGLGVKGAGSQFQTGYGVHFTSSSVSSYTFFADINENGVGDNTEINATSSSVYQLQKGEKLGAICGFSANNSPSCFGSGINVLDIIYIRPDPAAIITSDQTPPPVPNEDGSFQLPPANAFVRAVITVVSGLGDRYKCISVYQTGQVSVSNPTANGPSACVQ